jgi:very-short-patch-repair endonuclease
MQRRAQALRHAQTPEECLLWHALAQRRLLGAYFRRQVPIGAFVVDFYCAKAKLAIELDGAFHNRQRLMDNERTKWLWEARGIRVLRFYNREVTNNLSKVLKRIGQALTNSQYLISDPADDIDNLIP